MPLYIVIFVMSLNKISLLSQKSYVGLGKSRWRSEYLTVRNFNVENILFILVPALVCWV